MAREAGDLDDGVGRARAPGAAAAPRAREKRTRVDESSSTATARRNAAAADDVVAALASFENVSLSEMATTLMELDTAGRAALLRKFIVAKESERNM